MAVKTVWKRLELCIFLYKRCSVSEQAHLFPPSTPSLHDNPVPGPALYTQIHWIIHGWSISKSLLEYIEIT